MHDRVQQVADAVDDGPENHVEDHRPVTGVGFYAGLLPGGKQEKDKQHGERHHVAHDLGTQRLGLATVRAPMAVLDRFFWCSAWVVRYVGH